MSKHIKFLIIGLIAGLLLGQAFSVLADQPIKLIINGAEITADPAPQMFSGRVFVPARYVAEPLGATVEWDADRNAVVISRVQDLSQEQQPVSAVDNDDLVRLGGYDQFVKIGDNLYSLNNNLSLFIRDGKYYADNVNAISGLLALRYNDYQIRDSDNPFLKGTIALHASEFIRSEVVYTSAKDNHVVTTCYSPDKSKSYEISSDPKTRSGMVQFGTSYYIPISDIFNTLNHSLPEIQVDETQSELTITLPAL